MSSISSFAVTSKTLEQLNDSDIQYVSDYIASLSVSELEIIIRYAKDMYYNEYPVISDEVFDALWDRLAAKSPKSPILKAIGAPERTHVSKVKLPFWMGSLDKVKPDTKELVRWLSTFSGPYIISEKLDGLSGLLTIGINGEKHLYTRGDGEYGQNLDYLLSSIKIPKIRNPPMPLAIRGEFIISKEIFHAKYAAKYPKARSLVAGTINSKTPDATILQDMDFIVYEIIEPSNLSPETQFKTLQKLGFTLPRLLQVTELTSANLLDILQDFKTSSSYEIDGLVITHNIPYERNTSGNPKYSVAFKSITDAASQIKTTDVLEVEWNASKHGALKPRIRIKTVKLGGDDVSYATGFNARFISDNGVGPGAKVQITKSGDVIPYIKAVIEPAPLGAQMPSLPYHWNETRVDIILDDVGSSKDVAITQMLTFYKQLEVPHMAEGNVRKFYEAGFKTLRAIYELPSENYNKVEGLGGRMGSKIYSAIHEVLDTPQPLGLLMSASSVFGQGFGIRKLTPIIDSFPNILEKTPSISEVMEVQGFSDKSATALLTGLPKFRDFLANNPYLKIETKVAPMSPLRVHKPILENITVVFTGFRDKELESTIERAGGKVANSVNSKTSIVVSNSDQESSKIKIAKKHGIPVVSREEFLTLYAL